MHQDPGLQPERTSLAWTRTTMAMVVVAALFLRWMPQHGWFIGTLIGVTLCTTFGIYVTQKIRYRRAAAGISEERLHADVAAALWVSGSVLALGVLGVYTVLGLDV